MAGNVLEFTRIETLIALQFGRRFFADIVMDLSEPRKLATEGLFRVSGSVSRVKADMVRVTSTIRYSKATAVVSL